MAGHSQFKNIMHRKGAQDARRARQFAKIIREITVSARQGLPDPASNPRLRAAVIAARQANMPKDTVDRATVLANQMLALAKVEQLRQQAGDEVGDLAQAVRAIALELAPLVADKDIDFEIATQPAPVRGMSS